MWKLHGNRHTIKQNQPEEAHESPVMQILQTEELNICVHKRSLVLVLNQCLLRLGQPSFTALPALWPFLALPIKHVHGRRSLPQITQTHTPRWDQGFHRFSCFEPSVTISNGISWHTVAWGAWPQRFAKARCWPAFYQSQESGMKTQTPHSISWSLSAPRCLRFVLTLRRWTSASSLSFSLVWTWEEVSFQYLDFAQVQWTVYHLEAK